MKRNLLLLMIVILVFTTGCSSNQIQFSREEIVSVYKAAGYEVASGTYDDVDSGAIAYVQAEHPGGDYIHFMFFASEEDAAAYEKEMDHPIVKGFFSLLFSDPCWERVEAYGCIVVTYCNSDDFIPFRTLIKSK